MNEPEYNMSNVYSVQCTLYLLYALCRMEISFNGQTSQTKPFDKKYTTTENKENFKKMDKVFGYLVRLCILHCMPYISLCRCYFIHLFFFSFQFKKKKK